MNFIANIVKLTTEILRNEDIYMIIGLRFDIFT